MIALAYCISLVGFAVVMCSSEWRGFWIGQALIAAGLVLLVRAA